LRKKKEIKKLEFLEITRPGAVIYPSIKQEGKKQGESFKRVCRPIVDAQKTRFEKGKKVKETTKQEKLF